MLLVSSIQIIYPPAQPSSAATLITAPGGVDMTQRSAAASSVIPFPHVDRSSTSPNDRDLQELISQIRVVRRHAPAAYEAMRRFAHDAYRKQRLRK